jgi:enoyl-CoA hydratase/carnithine racemase
MPEIDWGITPGWGGTSRLARAVGWRKAKEWNLLGDTTGAANIGHFQTREGREQHRGLSRDFWQE